MDLVLLPIVALGCGTLLGIIVIDKVFDSGKKKLESALQIEQERRQMREARIAELDSENKRLQKDIDWYQRLLDGQSGASELPSAPGERVLGAPRQS
jgi:hypothetical protein